MKLKPNHTPYEQITSRLDTEDGKFYMGIFRVIFGYRIRAGMYENAYVHIDWCCGDDPKLLMRTYELLKTHMENWEGSEFGTPFDGLPTFSLIKPIDKDREFLDKIQKLTNISL